MAPKEKAKELVDKFSDYSDDCQPDHKNGTFYYDKDYGEETAKECALIAVNELIKENDPLFQSRMIYWEQVKEEIQKL